MSEREYDPDCIFCKIVNGEIPSDILYQDDDMVVFPDINPTTPLHLLVVPRRHIPSLAEISDTELSLVGKMVWAANAMAKEKGIAGDGYRVVINSGPYGQQEVPHLHLHLLGGRQLKWGM